MQLREKIRTIAQHHVVKVAEYREIEARGGGS